MAEQESPQQPDSTIPLVVLERVAAFDETLDDVETKLNEEIASCSYEDHLKRAPLDRARVDLLWLYAANSLFSMSVNVRGERLDKYEKLKEELQRVKTNFARLKSIEDRKYRPKVNKFAAKAFVRNAMFEVAAGGQEEDETKEAEHVDATELLEHETKTDLANVKPKNRNRKQDSTNKSAPARKKRRNR